MEESLRAKKGCKCNLKNQMSHLSIASQQVAHAQDFTLAGRG
jgi:hypothetical protein